MQIPAISDEDIVALVSRVEDQFYDAKAKTLNGAGAEKLAVALANADGGTIVIGIHDAKTGFSDLDRWDGAEEPEYFNGVLQALHNLNPSIPFRYDFLSSAKRAGFVLRIHVDKSRSVCQCSDGKVYQRVGAQSLQLKGNQVTQLAFAKGYVTFENTKLAGTAPEYIVDSAAIKQFVNEVTPVPDGLSYCLNEGLMDYGDWTPLAAGVLLFGDNPQGAFPTRCECRIVFYDTREEVPEREHLKINETIGGPLYVQIHKVVKRVTEIMSGISILTSEGMKQVSYPPEAILEILVNAILHRDYSIADDVQIIIFQNRIEVISPGKLPGQVTTQNILDVRDSRNPKLVRTLRRYKDAPNQDLGEGLNTAFQKMKEWKLQPPQIEERGNSVRVIIPHSPLATPEEAVMKYLEQHSEITNSIARDLSGIRSENQMKEVFYRLRDEKLIERVPDKKGNAAAWRRV